jgi:hypothetical protein
LPASRPAAIQPIGLVDERLPGPVVADVVGAQHDHALRAPRGPIRELNAQGHRTKSWTTQSGSFREGRPFDKGTLYKILRNRTYVGEAVHKGQNYSGEHEPMWDELYPAEQARIMRLLIERIDVATDGISVTLHAAGIRSLVAELADQEAPALAQSELLLEAAE